MRHREGKWGARTATARSVAAAVVVLVAGHFGTPAKAATADEIAGLWFDDSGRGAVEILPCGPNICGRIVWLKQPLDRRGRPLRDANNPVQERRRRPICGLPIIWGLRPQDDGGWDEGRIYDPKVGKSYDVAITRIGARQLRITGYLGTKLFSRDLIWQRAPNTLPRCQSPS